MFLTEFEKRLKFELKKSEPITAKMLLENLNEEMLPYWRIYKDDFIKLNKRIKYCINEIGYSVLCIDDNNYIINYNDINKFLEKYSWYLQIM